MRQNLWTIKKVTLGYDVIVKETGKRAGATVTYREAQAFIRDLRTWKCAYAG